MCFHLFCAQAFFSAFPVVVLYFLQQPVFYLHFTDEESATVFKVDSLAPKK